MSSLPIVLTIILGLVCSALGQVVHWPTNNGSLSSPIAGQFYEGNTLTISWAAINDRPQDLWLYGIDDNGFHNRLASNLAVAQSGSFVWNIAVGAEAVQNNVRGSWALIFIPTGAEFQEQAIDTYHIGPRFLLYQPGDAPPASSVTGSVPTTTASVLATSSVDTVDATGTGASATSPTDQNSDGNSRRLSGGTIGGIAAGVIISLFIVMGLLLWALRLRRKVNAANNHRSSGIVPASGLMPEKPLPTMRRISGLHEVTGSNHQPIEMDAKRKSMAQLHELAG